MKYLILIAISIITARPAFASYACFVESSSYINPAFFSYQPQALQCSTTKNLGIGLTAIGLSLQAGALYMACTGVGVPASLWIQGGSLGVSAVSMVVGELPCDDAVQEEKIKEMAMRTVCETLALSGINCAIK